MRHPRTVTATVLAGLLAAAGCSGSSSSSASSKPAALPAGGCTKVACTGTLSGAAYQIELPTKWNGTLLLWSHGYRSAVSSPPDFAPVNTAAEDAPSPTTAKALLAEGYALAGSSYGTNGWAVQDGVAAGEQLHEFFASKVAKPQRTYVWGASLGGLITELISEKHPDWVTGAAPECGAVAGTTENLDGALAIAYMVKTLIDPGLKITDYTSPAESIAAFQRATKSVTAAAQDVAGGGTAKVVAITTLAGQATQTDMFDGHDAVSTVSAKVQDILTAMAFATFGQQEFATRVGGQGLDITGLDFSKGVTPAATSTVKTYGGDLAAIVAQLGAGTRPALNASARTQAIAQGETTGKVTHPTVTLHDEQDPLVVVQNERVLGDRFYASGDINDLIQLFTKPPATYSSPAPYGAGHCNFTETEETGLVKVLDEWVRSGSRPSTAARAAAFAQPTGLDQAYGAEPFPLLGTPAS